MAIKSFRHKGVAEIFLRGGSRRVGSRYVKRMSLALDAMHAALRVEDLQGALGFHPLRGDLAGWYAMDVSGNWRLVFRFSEGDRGDVLDVDFVDYH